MADKIRMRRGLEADIPTLDEAEFGFTLDSHKLYIGADSGNLLVSVPIDDSDYVSSTQGDDGYIAFFTEPKVVAGESGLFWDSANSKIITGRVDLETTKFASGMANPPWEEGLVFYDNDEKALSIYNDQSAVTHQLGQEQLVRAKNTSGSDIGDGKVVYVTGASGNRPTLSLAQASTDATSAVIGVATHLVPNNNTGFITINGIVNDIPLPTATFSDGDLVYLSTTLPGELTPIKPDCNGIVVEIGIVLRAHDTIGKLLVHVKAHSDFNDLHGINVDNATNNHILIYDETVDSWGSVDANLDGYITATLREDDVTITVDPILGNDAYDGRTLPVATLVRAAQLIPADGQRNKIVLSAGDHKRIEPTALTDQERLTFGSFGSKLKMEGTTSVAETFTVLSSTTTTITKDSSTSDWTVDEHIGRMVEFNPLFGFNGFVVANTVDTLTLTKVAGAPSGDIDIVQLDSIIVPPDNNGDWAISRVIIWGNITLQNIMFDGGYCPLTVARADDISIINCAFKNHTLGCDAEGPAQILYPWFENCSDSGVTYSGGASLISNPAFINCGTGCRASFGATTTIAANSRVFGVDTTYMFYAKTNAAFNDENVGVYMDNVGTYMYMTRGCKYIKINSSIIVLNEDAGTNVFKLIGGAHTIQFLDSNNITIDATTPANFFDIDGTSVSLADYIDWGQNLEAEKGTFING